MTLHIFNPEHDMAMSHQYVTFPKVASLMYHGLGFLPALFFTGSDVSAGLYRCGAHADLFG